MELLPGLCEHAQHCPTLVRKYCRVLLMHANDIKVVADLLSVCFPTSAGQVTLPISGSAASSLHL